MGQNVESLAHHRYVPTKRHPLKCMYTSASGPDTCAHAVPYAERGRQAMQSRAMRVEVSAARHPRTICNQSAHQATS